MTNGDKRRALWSSEIDLDDWADFIEDLRKDYPDISDNEAYNEVVNMNCEYLNDLKEQLDLTVNGTIIAIADIGRWNGRRVAYRIVGDNLSDCFETEADDATWYVEGDDLMCEAIHHDGTNYIAYYIIPSNVEWDEDALYDAMFSHETLQKFIDDYMEPIGNAVRELMRG